MGLPAVLQNVQDHPRFALSTFDHCGKAVRSQLTCSSVHSDMDNACSRDILVRICAGAMDLCSLVGLWKFMLFQIRRCLLTSVTVIFRAFVTASYQVGRVREQTQTCIIEAETRLTTRTHNVSPTLRLSDQGTSRVSLPHPLTQTYTLNSCSSSVTQVSLFEAQRANRLLMFSARRWEVMSPLTIL
jgi:hypothetical protein